MATEGFVKFEYFSKSIPPYYHGKSIFPELLDDEKITVETPILEMSFHQYFGLFKKFLMSVGFDEKNVMQGACHLAFNESNPEEVMREVAEEYDLIMAEQLPEIIADRKKQDEEWIKMDSESWEQRYWALYNRFSKFAHLTDQDIENLESKYQQSGVSEKTFYNEDTSDKNMWDQGVMKDTTNISDLAWNGLVPGSPEARAAGCICPVLDNEEMPDDKKWIDVECPIHGRKNEGS
jgi:hypothetical protein